MRSFGDGFSARQRELAASLFCSNVTAVKQPIEDRRGHDLVAGEDLGPVLDRLVRGDELLPRW